MTRSVAAVAIGTAERAFPIVAPVAVFDGRPLARPSFTAPSLTPDRARRPAWLPLGVSLACLGAGVRQFVRGRRPAQGGAR
jgi:hypothetical protein